MNFTEGDSLKYIDRNDVNVTFELAWNVTKYFMVNPNCHFSNISFTAVDSPNDGDTLNDTIRADFTLNTSMPSDLVRVIADVTSQTNGVHMNYSMQKDFLISSPGSIESWNLTIPDVFSKGNFSVVLHALNSTGRIDFIRTLWGIKNYNDSSEPSEVFLLYHPLGYTKTGTYTQDVSNNISGSIFTAHEDG
jgi:hypothetical protein